MKTLKLTTVVMLLMIATSPLFGQDAKTEKEAVLTVMIAYEDAIQNLTTEGTFELFTPNATIFEEG